MSDRSQRVAVFVLVVALVVAASFGATALGIGGRPTDTPVNYPPASSLLPPAQEPGGVAVIEATPGEKRVLIDTGHANRHDEASLRPLVSALGTAGHEVELYRGRNAADLRASLAVADALVVIDPGNAYTADEADAVQAFVAKGGRLLVLAEPTRVTVSASFFGTSATPRNSRVGTLAGRFGVAVGTEYLYNEGVNDGNFKRVVVEGDGSLEDRTVDEAVLYTATTVEAADGTVLLVAGEGTMLSDGSDAAGRGVAVLAAAGDVLVVGDASFLDGNRVSVADNEHLVGAVADFLVSGERTFDLFDYPALVPSEVRLRYTDAALLNASKTLASDLRADGSEVTVEFTARVPGPNRTTVLLTTFEALERQGANGTGITVTATTVSAPGYESPRENVTVVRAPASGYDLVVAAETPAGVERGVAALVSGRIGAEALSGETAVLRFQPSNESAASATASGEASGTNPTGPATAPAEMVAPPTRVSR